MSILLLPTDEEDRLAALERYALLDTPPEAAFDRLAALVARLFQMPLALVTLSDCDRQDARFAQTPLVTDMGVRFYAGAPLLNAEGRALGTFCVMDFQPRTFSEEQRTALQGLAAGVVSEMELRRATAALAESEHLYRQMFEDSPYPMWVFDVETLRFLAVNATAVAHYGYAHAEFLAMGLTDIRLAADLPQLCAVLSGESLHPVDKPVLRHLKKDGALIWAEVAGYPVDYNGRPACMVIAHDVTERRESQEKYRLLAESMEDMVSLHEMKGRCLYASPSVFKTTGCTVEEMVGRNITALESVVQDDQRWRTLLHEGLHSVSVGLTEPEYQRLRLWEEAVVESLQRLYRPLLFRQLELDVPESRFTALEAVWPYNHAMAAVRRIAAERPEVPVRDFLEAMLRTPLPNRPAFAFEWGRQAADFDRFKRVYAAASGLLR